MNKVSPAALALMLTVAILPLYEAGLDHNVFYWVLLPLIVVTIIIACRNELEIDLSFYSPLLWYSLFLLWAGLSVFWSINPHRTLVEFLQLALYGLVFLLASSLTEDNTLRVGRIAFFTGFGVAIFGISHYLFLASTRIASTIGNANSLGILLVMLFLFGWGYYLRHPVRYLAIGSVFLLVALFLTISSGSLICLAVSLPLLFLGFNRGNIKPVIIKTTLLIVACLLFTLLIVLTAPYVQNLTGDNQFINIVLARKSTFIAWSGVSRFSFWVTGLKVALDNPIVGTGLGTFFLAYFTAFADNIWYSRFVHNHYIQTMAELGLVGILLLISFLAATIRIIWLQISSKKFPHYFPGLVAASAAFMIHIGGDFSWNFPGVAIIFFLASGLIAGVSSRDATKPLAITKKIYKAGFIAFATLLLLLTIWQLTANLFYRQGVQLEANNETAKAAIIYDRANRIYPINSMAFSFASNAYYRMAVSQKDPQLLEEALKRSEKAVLLSPVDGTLHNQLGRLYYESGYVDKAEYHFKIAADYASYRIGMLIDLGWLYIQQERFNEAEAVINRGLELKDHAQGMHPIEADKKRVEKQIETLYMLQEMINANK